MSLHVILWLASIGGGALFFLGGLLLGRARTTPRTHATEVADLATETEHLRGELARTRNDNERLEEEVFRLRQEKQDESEALAAATRTIDEERDRLRVTQNQHAAEATRLQEEIRKAQSTEADLRRTVERAQNGAAEVAPLRERIHTLEKTIEDLRLEQTRLQDREHQLERALSAVDPESEKTLRHDLVVAREQLRTLEERTKRLDEINFGLQRDVDAIARRAARVETLEQENQRLRVRVLAHDLSPDTPLDTAHGKPVNSANGESRFATHALQALVGQVADLESVRAAVIGDDLGLVVASQGTHGEELAAIGALLGRACGDARKILPLDRIQRVILEDEGNISVTVRSLRPYDSRATDDELTLVTLAYGTEPDPGRVARILGESGSPPAPDTHEAQQLGT